MRIAIALSALFAIACNGGAPPPSAPPPDQVVQVLNEKADGYKGLWYRLGLDYEYGDRYSGGLGTYSANHVPKAVYAEEVNKTFFVYGGTSSADERHLLIMASYYDHGRHRVPRPTIVLDKNGVDDIHDNPAIALDDEGFVWVFASGYGLPSEQRPGYKFRSTEPYAVDAFELVTEREMTYVQPWFIPGRGFLHLFTRYTDGRELAGFKGSSQHVLAGVRVAVR